MLHVGLARLARYFLLLSQEKVSKEKATPYRFILRLIASSGAACATQPSGSQNALATADFEQCAPLIPSDARFSGAIAG